MNHDLFLETVFNTYILQNCTRSKCDDALLCELTISEIWGIDIDISNYLIEHDLKSIWFQPEQFFNSKPFKVVGIAITNENAVLVAVDGKYSGRIYRKWKQRYKQLFKCDTDMIWVENDTIIMPGV